MSVIVKGMKMPKACTKCLFFIESDSPSFPFVECKFIGRLGSVFNFNDDVPIDCPLIELPPHGRLIDADALLKLLNNCMFPSDMVTTRAVSMAVNWLRESPTILEAEVEDG